MEMWKINSMQCLTSGLWNGDVEFFVEQIWSFYKHVSHVDNN